MLNVRCYITNLNASQTIVESYTTYNNVLYTFIITTQHLFMRKMYYMHNCRHFMQMAVSWLTFSNARKNWLH